MRCLPQNPGPRPFPVLEQTDAPALQPPSEPRLDLSVPYCSGREFVDYLDDAEALDILPMTNHGRSGYHRAWLLAGASGDTHAQSPESPAAGCTATRAPPAHPCPRPRPAHGAQLRSQVRRAQLSRCCSRFGGLGVGDNRPRVPRGSPARQVAGSSRRVVIRVTETCRKSIVLSSCIYLSTIFFAESRCDLEAESAACDGLWHCAPRGRARRSCGAATARQPALPSNRRGRDGHRPAAGGHHQKARL